MAFSAGLGWLAVRQVDLAGIWAALRQFEVAWGLTGAAVFLLAIYLRAYRWHLLFVDRKVSANRLFLVQNAGLGVNNFLPVRVVAEAVQFFLLRTRDRLEGGVILATVGAERLLDLVAASSVLALALLAAPLLRDVFAYLIAGVFLSIALAVVLVVVAMQTQHARRVQRVRLLREFLVALVALGRHRSRVAYALAVSMGYWAMVGMSSWLVARGMGIDFSPMTATVAILGTVFFSSVIPSVLGAAGTFELAVVEFLGLAGIDANPAFSYAVLMHTLLFVPSTIIALFVLPREGLGSVPRLWALRGAFRGAHQEFRETGLHTGEGNTRKEDS